MVAVLRRRSLVHSHAVHFYNKSKQNKFMSVRADDASCSARGR